MHFNHANRNWLIGIITLASIITIAVAIFIFSQVDFGLHTIPIPTRTPRPTFTRVPSPTPSPSETPTITPTIRPTRRVPTRAPTRRPTPTQYPTPTLSVSKYRYQSANKGCEHSGQTFIQGTIYRAQYHATEVLRVNGVTIALSGDGPDGSIATTRTSGEDGPGFYSIIVNADGPSPGQSRWLWVIEGGKRVSDVVRFDFNALSENYSTSCWRGWVDWIQLY